MQRYVTDYWGFFAAFEDTLAEFFNLLPINRNPQYQPPRISVPHFEKEGEGKGVRKKMNT